jgi:MraZ protein
MFFGEYEHALDDKNRVTLPARFRDAFSTGIVLSRGIDTNIDVWSPDTWRTGVESRLASLDLFTREGRDMRRFFHSGKTETDIDHQGRVLIPPALMRRAALAKDVVIAGVDDHLEIWDRAAWDERLRTIEGSADHVAERLADQRQ